MAEFASQGSWGDSAAAGWGEGAAETETSQPGGWGAPAEAAAPSTEGWGATSEAAAPSTEGWGAPSEAAGEPAAWGAGGGGESAWGAAAAGESAWGAGTSEGAEAWGATNENGEAPAWGASNEGNVEAENAGYEERVNKTIEHSAAVVKLLSVEDEEARRLRIRVIQSDESSHLSSAKSFSELGLAENLLSGVFSMGFDRPSAIQEAALPLILAEPPRNLIAQAQSGSGKTVAFVLGMLHRVNMTENHPQAICIAPTRELATQILSDVIVKMAKEMPGLRCQLALAGLMIPRGEKCTAHIVVGTPGKIEDWVRRGLIDPKGIKVFVLDEADEMICEDGHREKSVAVHREMPPTCQTLFFSATFSDDVFEFAKRIVRSPNIIKLASDEELVLDEIKQLWIDTNGDKFQVLSDMYDLLTMGQSIVFVQTKMYADIITDMLQKKGFDCATLHGDLEAVDRDLLMDEFRRGQRKVLITTNVLARGVDVPAVSLVLNYDVPRTYEGNPDFEVYLHRIGRTGRFGRKGVAVTFVNEERDKMLLEQIANHFSPTQTMIHEAPSDDVQELEKIIQGIQTANAESGAT